MSSLLQRLQKRYASIGIVGIGYVGLPLAVALAQQGFSVVGIDVDEQRVDMLNEGVTFIEDVPTDSIAPLVAKQRLSASTEYASLAEADVIVICVPTPLNKTGDPDVSFIIDAATRIAELPQRERLIVLESTTYPGTTEELVLPRLSETTGEVGQDFYLAFSPERIDPGRTDYTMFTTPKVIGGVTPACLDVAMAFYGTIVAQPVPVSTPTSAEMVKLLENTFRAVNIGLVNEVALMCDRLGVNVWEVIDAAATKPYGFMKFTPGPGLGGHCIPVDPEYLSWKLRTLNYKARFVELASEINSQMPEYVVGKVVDALNEMAKPAKGSHIVVVGVAYKPNVSDVRESPALDVIHLLAQKGANVTVHDPYVSFVEVEGVAYESAELSRDLLSSADCVVVITNHRQIDWKLIDQHAPLIVDTRNAIPQPAKATVVTL